MKKDKNNHPHWDLMIATVKEVATLKDGSVSRLEQEFLEEFGQLPPSDMIDYFVSMQEDKKKKILPLKTERKKYKSIKKDTHPEVAFANKIALEGDATILMFRKLFEDFFGKKPSSEILAHFINRLGGNRRQSSSSGKKTIDVNQTKFVQAFVSGKAPTILSFRKEFEKKFGRPPSTKVIAFFIKMMSEKDLLD